jgi:predicted ATPase
MGTLAHDHAPRRQDLLPALGRLILLAARRSQVVVVTNSARLREALKREGDGNVLELEKNGGATALAGQGLLD